MEEFESTYQELRKKLWITSGARFQAAIRLARRDRLSTLSIAGLSIVAIALGLIDAHITAGDRALAPLSTAAITAIISVFVLVISLIEANNQTQVRADRLHDSAVRISEVRTALEIKHAETASSDPNWASLHA